MRKGGGSKKRGENEKEGCVEEREIERTNSERKNGRRMRIEKNE